MSFNTRKPLRVGGSVLLSGEINTGALKTAQEGEAVYTALSGVNATTLILSGAGRLNAIMRTNAASGANVLFADSAVATSGAPFSTSGHNVIGMIQQAIGVLSGVTVPIGTPVGIWTRCDAPFFSGLIACPAASGVPGFSVLYTKAISG